MEFDRRRLNEAGKEAPEQDRSDSSLENVRGPAVETPAHGDWNDNGGDSGDEFKNASFGSELRSYRDEYHNSQAQESANRTPQEGG